MFLVEKTPTSVWFLRDRETGKYMGFDAPTAYWSEEAAKHAKARQESRGMSKCSWDIVVVKMPV